MNHRKLAVVLTLLITVLVFIPLLNTFAHEGGPHLRIAHFSDSSLAVDVYSNGELLVENLKYKEVTNYLAVKGGEFEFIIVPTGEKIENSVTEQPITLAFKADEGRYFTLAMLGSVDDKSFELFKFPADRGGEETSGIPAATAEGHDDEGDHHDGTEEPHNDEGNHDEDEATAEPTEVDS